MRISDWSSDVCSSDLEARDLADDAVLVLGEPEVVVDHLVEGRGSVVGHLGPHPHARDPLLVADHAADHGHRATREGACSQEEDIQATTSDGAHGVKLPTGDRKSKRLNYSH